MKIGAMTNGDKLEAYVSLISDIRILESLQGYGDDDTIQILDRMEETMKELLADFAERLNVTEYLTDYIIEHINELREKAEEEQNDDN